jgi:hydroxyacylglutathione hydrolase
MIFRQFYLGCLAHASYLIVSQGEAAVVDPQRDVQQYVDAAEKEGAKILYIIETHLHADFVSGHRELAERTGAEIVFGETANAEFAHRKVRDGEELALGRLKMKAIATPGHTPESVSWLITDVEDPQAAPKLLTGDTLFIGDVGRPDLAGGRGYTSEQMAGMLYDSLHEKILELDDAVEVWPAHGAGSACGKNISKERSSTIGVQRKTNYALQAMPREAFVEMMVADLPPPPRYFPMDAEINRRGARPLKEIVAQPLEPADVRERVDRGAVVLDVRDAATFGVTHVPGSINIGLDGQYASWAGTLLSERDELIVVAPDQESAEEAVMRLARVGLENVSGYLRGGVEAWIAAGLPPASVRQLSVGELQKRLPELNVIDVRRHTEFASARVPRARNFPLADLRETIATLDPSKPVAVICAGGYRSSIAASLLLREGFRDLRNVSGGTQAWVAAGFETERE